MFVSEPGDSFIIKSRPALLECVVLHSSKSYFTCNGEAMAKSDDHREKDLVNDNGDVVKKLQLEVSRVMVEEYFGVFTCQCDAWSTKGQVSSRKAVVSIACELSSFLSEGGRKYFNF